MSESSHMPADPGEAGPERSRLQLHTGQRNEEGGRRNGWDNEYDRDVWRLRELGIKAKIAHILFDRIPQPWLKDLAKRWARWRLSTGLGAESAASGTRAATHFAQFLASSAVRVVRLDQMDRSLLERYLARLHVDYAGRVVHRNFIGQLNLFFLARVTQALPNGFCSLPVQKSCPHANACLSELPAAARQRLPVNRWRLRGRAS